MAMGDNGERLFAESYWHLNPVKSTADLKYDFDTTLGRVELKTDSYPMDKTPNFFIEKFSDMTKESLGGPWRAAADGIELFVYHFINDGTFFWFKSSELCALSDTLITKRRERWIKNKAWTTLGYVIPREEFKKILLQVDSGLTKPNPP